jgi:glycosyltransferase involved in cell wall biosynthesis
VPWATQFARLVEGAAALNAIADVERRGSILGERSSRPLGLASVDVLLPFFSIGGAERQACDLARGLAADGVECRLLTLRAPSTHLYNEELQSASIELITLEQPEYSAALDLLRAVASGFEDVRVVQFVESLPPGVARDIAALVRYYHERPRTLVAYLETAGIVGAIAGVLIGAPAIVVALLSVSPERFTVAREDLSWLREALCAAGRNHAVRFVANSAFGASECSRWLLGAHVRVARNAGAEDLLAWDVQSMRIMVRETLGLPQDARLVVGVFRLSPEKRPHLFVEVASVLNHHLPGTRFVIVGDGPLTESTRRSVTEAGLDRALRIIERSDGRSFIAAADLLVHVSAIEGIPNVLLEAQFLGVPFVACDVGGLREGVAPCLGSYVLDDDDPQPLARAALDLLLDAEKSRRLGEQARREVQAQFSRRRLATDTMNHVEGVLQAVETFSRNGTADS